MRQTCLNMVHQLARSDSRVVFVGSDLGAGTLEAFRQEMPNRFFMEGISEQAVIGLAAGLAMEGYVPFVNTIATFLTRRSLEQIAIDVCLHRLPVRLIGSGGGMVYAPLGPTHTAIEDISLMRAMPGMAIVAPSDAEEMRALMPQILDWAGPVYIRLGKGGDAVIFDAAHGAQLGRAAVKRMPGDVLLISTGVQTAQCLRAAEALAGAGIGCGVVHLATLAPLDGDGLLRLIAQVRLVVTVEEHIPTGGLGTAVAELMAEHPGQGGTRLRRLSLPHAYAHEYGSQSDHWAANGLDAEGIFRAVRHAMAPPEE
jgi:transketolase